MHNKVPKNEYLKGKPGKKQNPYKKDVIYDPRGQWDYPGEVTKIPSGNITMQGVPYPVLGVDNLGYEQMMYPGLDYQFPGDTVTEYPQMQYGGDPSIPELTQAKKGGWLNKYSKLPKKTSSKNIKTSINKLMVKNPLFERNYMLYGAKGPRLYDPSSKYQTGGSPTPIYVNSVTDPRYQMYSDSVNLYKAYQYQRQQAGDLGQRTYNKPNYYQGIQQRSTPRYVPSLGRTMKDTYDTPSQVESAYPGHNNRNIIEYYKSLPFNYPTLIGLYDSPDIGHSKIKPIGEYRDKYSLSPIYKKPVQPVVVGTAPAPEPVKQPEPIQTPAPVEQPKASTPAEQPKTQPLYKKTQAPNLPPFYWKYDSTAKQWYQISEREYNNAPAEQKKTGGNTGWLDSYQDGGQNKPSASQEWIANNPGYLPSSMVTIIGEDNKPKQVRLDSQEYSDYWNKYSGKVLQPYTTTPTEDNPEGIMYQAPTMQTQTVTDKATGSGKHVLDFEKKEGTLEEWKAKQKETAWDRMMKNMKNVSYEDYLNQRDARLTSMYEDKKNNYVAGKILKDKPKGDKSRADWNQSFTPAERYFIDNSNKANKIKPSIFQTTAAGISRLNMPQIPGLNPFDKAIGLTPEESKNISGANALDILSYPTNVAWGALYDPEMSFGDAVSGQQTDKIPLGMQIAGDPLNLLGIGLIDEGADVLKGVNRVGDYLTQGPLKNAWKLNPKAYQYNLPENTMWRGLGQEGMEDAVRSRLFRTKQNIKPEYYPGTKLQINKSFGTNPYFTPNFKTAATYGDQFIAEVPRDVANWRNRYGRGKTWSQVADRAIPIEEGRILQKDWWRGYKPVNTPKQLPGSPNVDEIMSLSAPKGNMYGENQVLVQQSRLLNPETKTKFFQYQAPLEEPYIKTDLLGNKLWKQPKDYGNRITPENYEDFVKNIHSSTEYDLSKNLSRQPGNLGLGDYGWQGVVFSDAPLNNLGKDIINAHEKNHGIFAGTLSKEVKNDLLKPFGTNKPIPGYKANHQADEVLARMGQFKNAVGIGDDQIFTLGHLNLIRKNYANRSIDNGITEMLAKIKPGSKAEKEFLINMNKYAFGLAPAAIGAGALQEQKKTGGSTRKSGKKLVNYTQKPNFVKTQSNSWLDKY